MRKIKPKTLDYKTPSVAGLKSEKSQPIYPTFRLDLQHIPEAKDWKVGETYNVEMTVKMVGISQSRYDNSAEFEIHEIETGEPDNETEEAGEPAESE